MVKSITFNLKIHFVNWNAKRYPSVAEAVQSSSHDGLTVLGVFVEVNFSSVLKALYLNPRIDFDF
jgi:hypothetical protein